MSRPPITAPAVTAVALVAMLIAALGVVMSTAPRTVTSADVISRCQTVRTGRTLPVEEWSTTICI